MNTKQRLKLLCNAVIEEMAKNDDFKAKIEAIFDDNRGSNVGMNEARLKGKQKRKPSIINPYELVKQGEDVLFSQLENMDIEQLKDTILDYNMDNAKLAMKWKSSDRLRSLIVDTAKRRSTKGNVFLHGSEEKPV